MSHADSAFSELCRELDQSGRERFAQWDAEAFATLSAAGGGELWSALSAAPHRATLARAYLTLVGEGVGLGYFGHGELFDRCFAALPSALVARPRDGLALLARTWNLCEGLRTQPVWMRRCVSMSIEEVDVETLADQVARALDPLLARPGRASFAGPFAVSIVDLRPVADDFLPGELHFCGPVLCVHDRSKRPERQVALLLGGEANARVMGLTPCLEAEAERARSPEVGVPSITWRAERLDVGDGSVALPTLREVYGSAVHPSGFMAASATDSQRIWVVASP